MDEKEQEKIKNNLKRFRENLPVPPTDGELFFANEWKKGNFAIQHNIYTPEDAQMAARMENGVNDTWHKQYLHRIVKPLLESLETFEQWEAIDTIIVLAEQCRPELWVVVFLAQCKRWDDISMFRDLIIQYKWQDILRATELAYCGRWNEFSEFLYNITRREAPTSLFDMTRPQGEFYDAMHYIAQAGVSQSQAQELNKTHIEHMMEIETEKIKATQKAQIEILKQKELNPQVTITPSTKNTPNI